jgi:hypothetical protein
MDVGRNTTSELIATIPWERNWLTKSRLPCAEGMRCLGVADGADGNSRSHMAVGGAPSVACGIEVQGDNAQYCNFVTSRSSCLEKWAQACRIAVAGVRFLCHASALALWRGAISIGRQRS